MATVVGVRFRTVGKIYYFDPDGLDVSRGTDVIVETARGVEYGTVIMGPKDVDDKKVVAPLKPILRIASEEDQARERYNRSREREAYLVCREKIREHNLDMKLIQAEYTFDNNKLLFYFTADGRIDFRNLVKDLASAFRTRIELRQIGVRDETKILGGVGICGRELCCHTFLSDFAPVSIKMAKEQNLSLNPTKISGTCGRLMCCLNNEAETYEYLNSRLPKQGSYVLTPEGVTGRVQSVSVLRQHVKVIVENGDEREIREYSIEDLNEAKRRREESASFAEDAEYRRSDRRAEAAGDAGTDRSGQTPRNQRAADDGQRSKGGQNSGSQKNRSNQKRKRNNASQSGNQKTAPQDQNRKKEQAKDAAGKNGSQNKGQNGAGTGKSNRNHRRRKRPRPQQSEGQKHE